MPAQEVMRVAVISRRYLRSWFVLDAAASIPFTLISLTTASGGRESSTLQANKVCAHAGPQGTRAAPPACSRNSVPCRAARFSGSPSS